MINTLCLLDRYPTLRATPRRAPKVEDVATRESTLKRETERR